MVHRAPHHGSPPDPADSASRPARRLIARLEHRVRSDREELLEPLLKRLEAIAHHLLLDEDVPPERVEDGLVLWEAYLARLETLHVRRFPLAGPGTAHAERCAVPLLDIEGDPKRGMYRLRAIRAMWNGYNYHVGGYRQLLGRILLGEAQAELAWQGFVEDYAETCLPEHLTPGAIAEWSTAIDASERELPLMRAEIGQYLEHTAAFEEGLAPGSSAIPAE